MTKKALRLTLQISGTLPEEKVHELVGFLEQKIQDTLPPEDGPFAFQPGDVQHTTSSDGVVRIILLSQDVASLTPCELSAIMHSLGESDVVAGEYGVAFKFPCTTLTPVSKAA